MPQCRAIAFGPTTFALPSIMWLILKEPRRFGWHWAACWVCIIYGVVTTVFGSIGGLRSIIVKVRLPACSQRQGVTDVAGPVQ